MEVPFNMIIAQSIQFDRWCLECGATCRGRCQVVILSPESEFHPERVWQMVKGSTEQNGHDSRLATRIARRLAKYLKSQGVGVVVEILHSQVGRKLHGSDPLPVMTMSLSGRMRTENELRKECFRYVRG